MFCAFSLNCYLLGVVFLFLLKKQARRRRSSSSDVLALLCALRTLSSCSESGQAPRFLSRNLIGGEEKRKKTEDRVELGEDVKNDEREKKWTVTTESARSGLMEETEEKKRQN